MPPIAKGRLSVVCACRNKNYTTCCVWQAVTMLTTTYLNQLLRAATLYNACGCSMVVWHLQGYNRLWRRDLLPHHCLSNASEEWFNTTSQRCSSVGRKSWAVNIFIVNVSVEVKSCGVIRLWAHAHILSCMLFDVAMHMQAFYVCIYAQCSRENKNAPKLHMERYLCA